MNKVIWHHSNIYKLIDIYKSNTELWDTACPDHKNKLKRKAAWISIANEMNIPLDEVQRKMNSLLRTFRKQRLKQTPNWFAYEQFKFLLKTHEKKPEFDLQLYEPEIQFQLEATLTENVASSTMSTLSNSESNNSDIANIDETAGFIKYIRTKMSKYSIGTKNALQREFTRVFYQADIGYYDNEIKSAFAGQNVEEQHY